MHIRSLTIPFLVVGLLISCTRSTEKMLVGRWKNTFPDAEGIMFLRADHVVLGLRLGSGEVVTKGHWRVADNQLYQSIEASGPHAAIQEFAWTILELDSAKLRVHTIGETEVLFLRID